MVAVQPSVISTSKLNGSSSAMRVILVEQSILDEPMEVTVFFTVALCLGEMTPKDLFMIMPRSKRTPTF